MRSFCTEVCISRVEQDVPPQPSGSEVVSLLQLTVSGQGVDLGDQGERIVDSPDMDSES